MHVLQFKNTISLLSTLVILKRQRSHCLTHEPQLRVLPGSQNQPDPFSCSNTQLLANLISNIQSHFLSRINELTSLLKYTGRLRAKRKHGSNHIAFNHVSLIRLALSCLFCIATSSQSAHSACTVSFEANDNCFSSSDIGSVKLTWLADVPHSRPPTDEYLVTKRTYVDYQNSISALTFRRTNTHRRQEYPSELGLGWRHTYDVILVASGSARHIYQSDGSKLIFEVPDHATHGPIGDEVVYRGLSSEYGTLSYQQGEYIWSTHDGWIKRFRGSFLTSLSHDNGNVLSLFYKHNRLARVTDQYGQELLFNYATDGLNSVTLPDTNRIEYRRNTKRELTSVHHPHANKSEVISTENIINASSNCIDPAPTNAQPACDTATSPPPLNFAAKTHFAKAIRLDARPASCRSYFVDYYGTDRGSAIEQGFAQVSRYQQAQATVRSFPIVDFLLNGEAIVVKSRDLTNATYNNPANPDAIYNRLIRDGSEIENKLLLPMDENGSISVTEHGTSTTLYPNDVNAIVLELVIQAGMVSTVQFASIERARSDLLKRWGIVLRVIEIP